MKSPLRHLRRTAVTMAATSMLGAVLAGPAGPAHAATPSALSHYSVSAVYASGVSSGGFMADQLHVAYSGTVKGAGIFAGGPYHCAQGSLTTAEMACMYALQDRQLGTLEQTARNRSAQGTVDNVANLSGHPVYVFHGTADSTVKAPVSDDLVKFYKDFGANVRYDNTTGAGHSWVSPLGPNPCSSSYSPYVNNCGNDPEGTMLGHLFGSAAAPAGSPGGTLSEFDQNAYAPGGSASSISMAAKGYTYVPKSCASGTSCRLMVALHGCLQGAGTIGTTFVTKAHLNEYGDTNNMIVLYPQAIATMGSNPQGCWDWWGYLGAGNYDTHGGAQIESIMKMVHALGG
jgi:poly(3-hydroxybutyrate) depolymerase